MFRIFSLLLAVVALAMFVGSPLPAQVKGDKNTHEGTLVSIKGNEFTMKPADNKLKEHKHVLAKDAKVIGEDGKECRLADIKTGQTIRVTTREDDMRVALRVEVMKRKTE